MPVTDIASKWNAQYAWSGKPLPAPAEVLTRGERWLPGNGKALDLACGRGASALWLQARGFETHAWDISQTAIAQLQARAGGQALQAIVRDVEKRAPQPASFDVIVVCRFLHRPLCPAIADALRPGGMLFYQTFTHGLSNPDYLLEPNELLTLFPTLNVSWYFEAPEVVQGKAQAMLIAQQPDAR